MDIGLIVWLYSLRLVIMAKLMDLPFYVKAKLKRMVFMKFLNEHGAGANFSSAYSSSLFHV